jgi:hypothetical protein
VPVAGEDHRYHYQFPGRCRLGILIFRIVVPTQFIRSDSPNPRFRMYRLLRLVNLGEG